jgi:hypothetical protein
MHDSRQAQQAAEIFLGRFIKGGSGALARCGSNLAALAPHIIWDQYQNSVLLQSLVRRLGLVEWYQAADWLVKLGRVKVACDLQNDPDPAVAGKASYHIRRWGLDPAEVAQLSQLLSGRATPLAS